MFYRYVNLSLTEQNRANTLFIGDSITAGVGVSNSSNIYYKLIDNYFDYYTVNVSAVGGSCWSVKSNYGTNNSPLSVRINTIIKQYSFCDNIVIFMRTNDFAHNTPLGTINDTTDISFYGAMNEVISKLINLNPSVKITLIGPLYRLYNGREMKDLGLSINDYSDALSIISSKYGIDYIECESFVNVYSYYLAPTVYNDSIHPNDQGHKIFAEYIIEEIKNRKTDN